MIKILVDSGSDINKQQAEEMGVTLIPIEVRFGDEEYFDGVDLLPKEFFEKLEKSTTLPQTSMINSYRFEEEFKKATQNGDTAIYISLSSKISGTYNAACEAAKKFDGKVFVVDSLSATAGQRILCELALRLVNENKPVEEIVEILNEKKLKIQVVAMVDTLKYLKMGGRISSLVAFAGELLNIKPIISLVDGEVKMIGKGIGVKKSMMFINDFVKNKGGIDYDMPFKALFSGNNEEIKDKFVKNTGSIWEGVDNVEFNSLGSTIGTHIGPGAVGLAFFTK